MNCFLFRIIIRTIRIMNRVNRLCTKHQCQHQCRMLTAQRCFVDYMWNVFLSCNLSTSITFQLYSTVWESFGENECPFSLSFNSSPYLLNITLIKKITWQKHYFYSFKNQILRTSLTHTLNFTLS